MFRVGEQDRVLVGEGLEVLDGVVGERVRGELEGGAVALGA